MVFLSIFPFQKPSSGKLHEVPAAGLRPAGLAQADVALCPGRTGRDQRQLRPRSQSDPRGRRAELELEFVLGVWGVCFWLPGGGINAIYIYLNIYIYIYDDD